jgi:hypothetical protein
MGLEPGAAAHPPRTRFDASDIFPAGIVEQQQYFRKIAHKYRPSCDPPALAQAGTLTKETKHMLNAMRRPPGRRSLSLLAGVAAALSLAIAASPGSAQQPGGYGYCRVGSHEAISPIFAIDYDWYQQAANREQVVAQWTEAASRVMTVLPHMGSDCTVRRTLAQANDERGTTIRWYSPDRTIPFTPSAPGSGSPVSTQTVAAGPALTVKTDTGLQDAGKAWDEAVRAQLRREAAGKAKAVVDAARADAAAQAQMAKFFEEMKKRGSAQ